MLKPKRKILLMPGLHHRSPVFKRTRDSLPAITDNSSVYYYFRGCTALWQGLMLLKKSQCSTVIFPAYHCGIELDTILKAGFKVQFYPVGNDLSLDAKLIKQMILNHGNCTVYIIHYFGFAHGLHDLKQFCSKHGCYIIEDCAQSLYAKNRGQEVGTNGDIAIYSFQKSLPVPMGGMLVVNNRQLSYRMRLKNTPLNIFYGSSLKYSHVTCPGRVL